MPRMIIIGLLVLVTTPLMAALTEVGAAIPKGSERAIVDAVSENAHSIFDQIRNSAP